MLWCVCIAFGIIVPCIALFSVCWLCFSLQSFQCIAIGFAFVLPLYVLPFFYVISLTFGFFIRGAKVYIQKLFYPVYYLESF